LRRTACDSGEEGGRGNGMEARAAGEVTKGTASPTGVNVRRSIASKAAV